LDTMANNASSRNKLFATQDNLSRSLQQQSLLLITKACSKHLLKSRTLLLHISS